MLGEAMSIFDRNVRLPSGNSPFFMRVNRSRLSSTRAIAERAVFAGLVGRAAIRLRFLGERSQT